jgi:hypothetical protein
VLWHRPYIQQVLVASYGVDYDWVRCSSLPNNQPPLPTNLPL